MIINSDISLEPLSTLRNDAINSIKYTLLLDYKIPFIDNTENLIPEIMKNCHECCSGLFRNKLTENNDQIYFSFFGDSFPPSPPKKEAKNTSNKENTPKDLSFLDKFPPNDYIYPSIGKIGFPTLILDHCIISSYHAIISDLLHGKTITAYEIVNNVKFDGFYSLYKKNRLNLISESILKKGSGEYLNNSKKSSTASDFTKKANSHFKSLPQLESLFRNTSTQNITQPENRYYLQFSGVFSRICAIDSRKWNSFSSKIKETNKYNKLENFESLSDRICPRIKNIFPKVPEKVFPESSGDPVDGLYHRYLIERIFNFNLVYCLLRNIHRLEKKTSFRLSQKEIFLTLSGCQKLPNVFSRQYFLQYALEKLITEPMSHLDFWHEHQLDLGSYAMETTTRTEKYFHFPKWLEQLTHFFDYMAEYVIPIYEWCFINMLMDVIEKTSNPCDTHNTHLIRAMEILANHMKKNYEKILRPINIPSYQDTLDLITTHKSGVEDLNFSASFLQLLFDTFCSPTRKLDLNLLPLNHDFFVLKNVNSERHIRDFYINLLFP